MIKTKFLLISSILKTRRNEVYPNVLIALQIMLNFPDTVASAERSFSKPNLIKTFNRSHFTDSRLSLLVMLSIKVSCLRSLALNDVIKAFACQKTWSKPSWYYFIMWHCSWYFHGYSYVIFFMCAIVPLYSDFFYFAVWLRSASWVALHFGRRAKLDCYGTGHTYL